MIFSLKASYICYTCHVEADGFADASYSMDGVVNIVPVQPKGWKFFPGYKNGVQSFCSERCALNYNEKSPTQA